MIDVRHVTDLPVSAVAATRLHCCVHPPFPFPIAEILDSLCQDFLPRNVSAILYLTNSELFGRSTASSQYFLQLASYLGIPVVAWNADNSGLERRVSCIAINGMRAKRLYPSMAVAQVLFWISTHCMGISSSVFPCRATARCKIYSPLGIGRSVSLGGPIRTEGPIHCLL